MISPIKAALAAALAMQCAGALAADSSPTPAPSPAAATPAPPSPSALQAAASVLELTGTRKSLDLVVPSMLAELERRFGLTRPEIKDTLHQAVAAVTPEFAKTEQAMLNGAANSLATQLSEAELKDVAAFYQSASGKKFREFEPALLSEISGNVLKWRQALSVSMLARVREEMKKKGVDF